ncbi:BnaC01g14780D [Brassica napus]|uniref:BnaC01g14780D protein n=2 Tax=Brassica TaxID=3705 RepID=A0A078FFJ6_BRANA|nr:BnaC01g14780D [Brassica napus]
MSSSRSHLDHRPPGFGVPPSVFETLSWARAVADGFDEFGGSGPELV